VRTLIPKEIRQDLEELDLLLATVIQIEGQQDPVEKTSK
jgi:hypothetical protein